MLPNSSLYQIAFEHQADKRPDENALFIKEQHYTFSQIKSYVERTRLKIRALNVSARDAIAIYSSQDAHTYAAILACLAEGVAFVPLNPKFPRQRNADILALAQPIAVMSTTADHQETKTILALYDTQSSEKGPEADDSPTSSKGISSIQKAIEYLLLDDSSDNTTLVNDHSNTPPLTASIGEENLLAYVLFTSGSTGIPKGVVVNHKNLRAYLEGFITTHPMEKTLRFSQMFELTFDLSLHNMLVCWNSGGCLYVPSEGDLIMSIQFMRRHAIDVWFSVPSLAGLSHYSGLLRKASLPAVKHSFFCGEPLTCTLANAWQIAAPNTQIYNVYGPTECTITLTSYHYTESSLDNSSHDVVPIGRPLPNQEALVIDETGNPCAPNIVGELWLGGDQVTEGYLKDEAKSKAAFVSSTFANSNSTRWYRTGDIARTDDAGLLHFLGRRDRQIKLNGFRVELLEVEHLLRCAANSPQVAVVAIKGKGGQNYASLVGFVVQNNDDITQIRCAFSQLAPHYMVLSDIVSIEQLPQNINRKVDYGVLSEMVS